MEIIAKIKAKIANLIGQAVLKEITKTGFFQIASYDKYEQNKQATLITPYGLFCYPDDGALLQVFQVQGKESNKFCFASDPKNTPDLEKGEVVLMNIKTGKKIKFNKDGDINIQDGLIVKNNGDIEITGGNVTIDGTTTIESRAFLNHTHEPGTFTVSVGGTPINVTGVSGGVV